MFEHGFDAPLPQHSRTGITKGRLHVKASWRLPSNKDHILHVSPSKSSNMRPTPLAQALAHKFYKHIKPSSVMSLSAHASPQPVPGPTANTATTYTATKARTLRKPWGNNAGDTSCARKKQEQCQIEKTCQRGIDLSNTSNATILHKYKRGSDPAHLLRRFALRSVGHACLKANRSASTAK